MQIFRFGQETARSITQFDSNLSMSRILMTAKPARIGCMYLETNGIIGFHPAATPQILLVVYGHGWVRVDSEKRVHVETGDAVFWETGEEHETRTDTGLIAIVIESDELDPSQFMPSRA